MNRTFARNWGLAEAVRIAKQYVTVDADDIHGIVEDMAKLRDESELKDECRRAFREYYLQTSEMALNRFLNEVVRKVRIIKGY